MMTFWTRCFCIGAILLASLLAGCTTMGESKELKTSSDMTDAQKRSSIRLQLGVAYYQQRQLAFALDEIKLALAADGSNADAYSVRAMIYMEMGETQLAEENFKRALSLSPNNPDFANNYGWFLCQNGQEAQSIAHFQKAFGNRAYQSPDKALNNAGLCSLKMKDDKAAEDYFNQAFKYNPQNPVTNINMARLYYTRDDIERAHFYLSRVSKPELMTADMLWVAIKIEHRRQDRSAESMYAAHLRRAHPTSPEYSAYQRGAFNE